MYYRTKNRHLALTISLILLFVLRTVGQQYIVKNGMGSVRIYLPDDRGPATNFAAQELKDHIEAMTGVSLSQAWRERLPSEAGFELSVREPSEWEGKQSAQGFTIQQALSPPLVRIIGNTDLGVLYGVYTYLGGLGARWYTPGEIGTSLPRLDAIKIQLGETFSEPLCVLRSLDLSGTVNGHFGATDDKARDDLLHDYALWTVRNRLHFRRGIHDVRYNRFGFNRPTYYGGHSLRRFSGLDRLFSDKDPADFKLQPERWPMLTRNFEKVRTNAGPHQICFTNEDNIRDAIENCVRRHREIEEENNDLQELSSVSLSLADCTGICECDACLSMAGAEPNSQDRLVWSFMNRVARGLNERMPGRKFMIYAPYYELTQPPPDVKIEPNIIAVSCRSYSWDQASGQNPKDPFTPNYRKWIERTREAGPEQAVYDYVLMPFAPQPLDILDAFNEYQKLGYRYYQPEVMQRSEQTWPILWALAQASWGHEKTPRELFEVFCSDYYGAKNGKIVVDLLNTMTENSRQTRRICYGSVMNSSVMLPDTLIADTRARLLGGLRSADSDKERERLRRFSDSMEVHFQLAEMFRTYADALNMRTPEKIDKINNQALDFMSFWDANNLTQIFSRSIRSIPEQILKQNFSTLKPTASATDFHDQEIVLKTLFVDERIPDTLENLFVLPEVWKLKLDPRGVGRDEAWFAEALSDLPVDGWQQISIWNFIESQGYGHSRLIDGDFWYRLRFKAPAFSVGKRVYLRFGALDDEGTVYINGKLIADQRTVDGHTWKNPFEIDVTNHLRIGAENQITVHGYDAEGGGGIWRPVVLYTR